MVDGNSTRITIKDLVASQRHCSIEAINDACTLVELGIDSLGALDLVYRIEELTGVSFSNDVFARFLRLPLRDIDDAIEDYVLTHKNGIVRIDHLPGSP